MGLFDSTPPPQSQEQYQPIMQTNPMPQGMMNNQANEGIASMRWESDPIIQKLYITLGGYELSKKDNNFVLLLNEKKKPLMNDVGIGIVMGIVNGCLNPVTSLSNVDDEETNLMIAQELHRFNKALCLNNVLWGVEKKDMPIICDILYPIIFYQFKRSVEGHESRNFRTQTMEQTVDQRFNQNPNSGGFFSGVLGMNKKR